MTNERLTLKDIEEHLHPQGNVDVLEQDGDPPSAVGQGAPGEGEGERQGEPSSSTPERRPASGR